MYFYAIVIISILLPLVIKKKVVALRISMILLFILLGFQYQLVQDWVPNIGRWEYVNEGASEGALATAIKMGPVFMWLLKVLKPITFFGWLMLSAAVFLFLIYKLIKYYVPQKYYWLAILILMFNVEYAPLIINSNRQCLSIIFTLIGVLFLLGKIEFKFKIPLIPKQFTRYIMALIFFFLGSQCHSVAYMSFLLFPIYYLSQKFIGRNWILLAIVCDFIFLGRMFLDVTWLQNYVTKFSIALNVGDISSYTDWFDNSLLDISISYTFVYCVIITLIAYYYRNMSAEMKFFAISWYIGWTIASYFTGNINRFGEYFYIFGILIIPYTFNMVISYEKNTKRFLGILILFLFIGYSAAHSWTQMHTIYYERWLDYKSVFDAPQWE